MEAAQTGNLEKLQEAFPEGCDVDSVNRKDEDARTALHWACASAPRPNQRHTECVQYLLARGAKPQTTDDGGWTPLLSAASAGNEDVVRLLLAAKVDVNQQEHNSESSPLHLASAKGHAGTAKCLIQHGADVGATDRKKQTPLHRASGAGKAGVVEILLSGGAKVNVSDKEGNTPLHLAMYEQCGDVCIALLGANASTKTKNNAGETPPALAPDSFCASVLER
mmetsp:Transcript_47343/g.115290  ORF Transcript_47343/g.115290 Transcript_47343/m.115290 type:complete len:223 (-) Transcript_47343:197-865(-)